MPAALLLGRPSHGSDSQPSPKDDYYRHQRDYVEGSSKRRKKRVSSVQQQSCFCAASNSCELCSSERKSALEQTEQNKLTGGSAQRGKTIRKKIESFRRRSLFSVSKSVLRVGKEESHSETFSRKPKAQRFQDFITPHRYSTSPSASSSTTSCSEEKGSLVDGPGPPKSTSPSSPPPSELQKRPTASSEGRGARHQAAGNKADQIMSESAFTKDQPSRSSKSSTPRISHAATAASPVPSPTTPSSRAPDFELTEVKISAETAQTSSEADHVFKTLSSAASQSHSRSKVKLCGTEATKRGARSIQAKFSSEESGQRWKLFDRLSQTKPSIVTSPDRTNDEDFKVENISDDYSPGHIVTGGETANEKQESLMFEESDNWTTNTDQTKEMQTSGLSDNPERSSGKAGYPGTLRKFSSRRHGDVSVLRASRGGSLRKRAHSPVTGSVRVKGSPRNKHQAAADRLRSSIRASPAVERKFRSASSSVNKTRQHHHVPVPLEVAATLRRKKKKKKLPPVPAIVKTTDQYTVHKEKSTYKVTRNIPED